MNRNKYIYASALGTFVVESDYNKGGTWTGATEAIKNGWGKVFVWNKPAEGNKKLIEVGGSAYEITEDKLVDTISRKQGTSQTVEYTQMSFMDIINQ